MSRAVILAGGRGTRLHPFTIALPKPLVPIGDRPILEIVIRQLIARGFTHVTLAVNHQAEIIRAYFGDGGRWNIKIDYSLEKKPLSTMAPLRLIADLPDDFLVMNGDVLTDLAFDRLLDAHSRDQQLFTISAAEREQTIDYGVLRMGADGYLAGFEEKPKIPYCVSMGVYCVNKKVLDLIPQDQSFGFDQLMLKMIAERRRVRTVVHNGYWLDIGRPDDYRQALEDWPTLQAKLEP
jgi:NDP-sugar pyrophosphorylase family protein